MSKFLNKIVILFKQYDVSEHYIDVSEHYMDVAEHYMDVSEAHWTNIVAFHTI